MIALLLVGLLQVATPDCVVDGSPDLQEASQKWCTLGLFEKVHAEHNDENTKFRAYLAFNDDGMDVYKTEKETFWNVFGTTVNKMGQLGINAEVQFRHGGIILSSCYTNFVKKQTVCEDYKGVVS
jgi:hypothetical protein